MSLSVILGAASVLGGDCSACRFVDRPLLLGLKRTGVLVGDYWAFKNTFSYDDSAFAPASYKNVFLNAQ